MAARSLPVWDIYLTKQEAVEDTPSRKDGMLKPVEANHRRSYVQLITSVCAKFKTNPEVPMIVSVYCHRFFAARSMVRNDRFMVTTAAIFLAFKVSDICPPLRHVLTVTYSIYNSMPPDEVAKLFMDQDNFYRSLKRKVLQAERSLLYVIGFNFKPEIPSKYFLPKINKPQAFPNLTDEQRSTLRQICLNFSNDTLKTTLWLQYSAKELAYGFIYLTAKLSRFPLETGKESDKEWFEDEGISVQRMKDITNELLDLYERSGKGGKGSSKRSKSKQSAGSKKEAAAKQQSADSHPAEPSMSVPMTPDLPPASPSHANDEGCKHRANGIAAQPMTAQV